MAPSDARRDRWGRYLVVPPGATRAVGYTRATTIAKALDDQGGLMPWKAAMAITGLLRRQGLRAQAEALHSQHPDTGAWYGGPDAKKAIKDLVEQCAEAGGSADRADVGTALHAIIEQINLGERPHITQDSTRADVEAYQAAINQHGIRFDPNYIEASVVLDEYRIAGTADMLRTMVPGVGQVIADLKTGSNLTFSWQSIAVQLAIYAHADALYRQGDATDGSQDIRHPAPDVRQDVALVIHLPAGEARCDLYLLDIAAGWEAFQHSMWARTWRSRKDLANPLPAPALLENLDARLAELLDDARQLPAEQAAKVKAAWPVGAPPLTVKTGWTAQLVGQVAQLIGEYQSCESPGADTITAPTCPVGEEAATSTLTSPSTTATADPPGDSTIFKAHTPVEWAQKTVAEQDRLTRRGHLPIEYRTTRETLAVYKARFEELSEAQQEWVTAQARLIDLPNLGHPHLWTIERGENLAGLLAAAALLDDQANVPEPINWPAIISDNGLTKAATLRKAKELGKELDIKVPSSIDRLPTSGPLAEQLAEWARTNRRNAA